MVIVPADIGIETDCDLILGVLVPETDVDIEPALAGVLRPYCELLEVFPVVELVLATRIGDAKDAIMIMSFDVLVLMPFLLLVGLKGH